MNDKIAVLPEYHDVSGVQITKKVRISNFTSGLRNKPSTCRNNNAFNREICQTQIFHVNNQHMGGKTMGGRRNREEGESGRQVERGRMNREEEEGSGR